MEPKVSYVLVGAFVAVLGAILVSVVLWLGKGDYATTYERYDAYMRESVAGLSVNSPVKYHGVEVGRVADIALNPENPEEVKLSLDIVKGTPVREDTTARLRIQGLTGFATVDLTGGSPDSPPLRAAPGEEAPVIRTEPSLLARIDESGSRFLANLNRVSEDAAHLVDEENRAALKEIVTNLAAITEAVAGQSEHVSDTLTHATETTADLAAVSRTLRKELPGILERLDRIAAGLEEVTADAARSSEAVATIVTEAGPGVERSLADTGRLVAELRELTASLTRLARRLEENPNALVVGRGQRAPGPGE